MKKYKFTTFSLAVLLLVTFSLGAVGSSTLKEIKGSIDYGMKMKLHNQTYTPTEANGTELKPIIYNNRTYLPVRAVAEAVGLAVDYDNATKTVYLGSKEWTPLTAKMTKGDARLKYSSDIDLLSVGGKAIEQGLVAVTPYGYCYADIELNGKYQNIKFECFSNIDWATITVEDYYTGEVYKKVDTTADLWNEIEVNLKGAKTIRIKIAAKEGTKVVLANPVLN